MPCYRCGARQRDPERGPSPWKRGVRAGEQVLVCPDCQRDPAWTDELQHCPSCSSTSLARLLGDTVCRACGTTIESDVADSRGGATTPGLAEDVEAAIARVLKRDAAP